MAEFPHDKQHGDDKTDEMPETLSDERLYTELRKDFVEWFESVDAENFDEELLDAFLAEMEELKPLGNNFDSQSSLEAFHERISSLPAALSENSAQMSTPEKLTQKHHRLFYRAITVAATVAIMVATMMTAQALGVDVFGFLAKWTNDIFFFENGQTESQEPRTYPLAEGERAEYKSIDDALMAFDIDLPLSPSWVPEYVGAWKVSGTVMPSGMQIFAFTEDESGILTWEVSEFTPKDGPSIAIEKDAKGARQYESHGQTHYIIEDNGCNTATWIIDNIQCIISGFITEEELLKVIDSIYEVV